MFRVKDADSSYNLAPKHMAMPLGFSSYFSFIETPRKTTYQNVKREGAFTVSFSKPKQIFISSLTASQREEDQSKPIIEELPTTNAKKIEGKFLTDSYFQLKCQLSEFLGKFGEWELIVGKVMAAYVQEGAMKKTGEDRNDSKMIYNHPHLAYLHPDRFSVIKKSHAFPLPKDFKR